MNEDFSMSGWLKKKGEKGLIKTWKLRWFLIREDRILYFERENFNQKGQFPLSQVLCVDTLQDVSCGFSIVTTGRTYLLQAMNENEKKKWVQLLERRISVDPSELIRLKREHDLKKQMMDFEYNETITTLNAIHQKEGDIEV